MVTFEGAAHRAYIRATTRDETLAVMQEAEAKRARYHGRAPRRLVPEKCAWAVIESEPPFRRVPLPEDAAIAEVTAQELICTVVWED